MRIELILRAKSAENLLIETIEGFWVYFLHTMGLEPMQNLIYGVLNPAP